MLRKNILFFFLLLMGSLVASDLSAITLEEALTNAYLTSPELLAEQSELMATEENLEQAHAGWLPTITATAEHWKNEKKYASGAIGRTAPTQLSLNFSQPIFKGFRTVANVRKAKAQITAEEARLFAREQKLFMDVLTIYLDVLRDTSVLELTTQNEERLKKQLRAAKIRRRVGELTKTDVAQAQSRYALSIAERLGAIGNIESRKSTFEKIVGIFPETLTPFRSSFYLPKTKEEAIHLALENNPEIFIAMAETTVADEAIRTAQGSRLPDLTLSGFVKDYEDKSTDVAYDEWQMKATLSIPLYRGGALTSRLRQSRERKYQKEHNLNFVRRNVAELTSKSWYELKKIEAQLVAYEETVKSAETAYDGVKKEARFGARTVLDILDAQQELLQAEVNFVKAKRDEFVARYRLLASIGDLTLDTLKIKID
ncbi:MAG: TolC family outer membrane protein [Alphaproteobacteria bacterium]